MSVLQFVLVLTFYISLLIKFIILQKKLYCVDDDLLRATKIQLLKTIDAYPTYLNHIKINNTCKSVLISKHEYINIFNKEKNRKIFFKYDGKLSNQK